MAHEITLEKAEEMAYQAELVCLLLESYPGELQDGDVSAIASLLADHQQQAIEAVREAESRWRSLIPADYGEQVHRVPCRQKQGFQLIQSY
ncbi:hypothetical protein B4903_11615 [Yersinia frederiksenii]|nr:hypothetical protein B4903_11615 [Yersinia frederiksenii]